jgi:hypothetical protein
MPYQPYDTGWIKSIYYGVLCLAWYITTRGTLLHLTSARCYNNMVIPFIRLFNKSYEILGNIIVAFGSGIIHCKSTVFKHFNYIDPIYNVLKCIEHVLSVVDIKIGNPTFQSTRLNSRNNKSSTRRHLGEYFAQKRLCRQRSVISGSIHLKNDNNIEDTPQHGTTSPQQPDSTTILFHPIDDPSYQVLK